MTRNYPFFTQIAYIAHFWNSVVPIYSAKNVANQKRCVGGVPVELNLLYLFASKKLTFQKKNYPDPKRIFAAEKRPFRWF